MKKLVENPHSPLFLGLNGKGLIFIEKALKPLALLKNSDDSPAKRLKTPRIKTLWGGGSPHVEGVIETFLVAHKNNHSFPILSYFPRPLLVLLLQKAQVFQVAEEEEGFMFLRSVHQISPMSTLFATYCMMTDVQDIDDEEMHVRSSVRLPHGRRKLFNAKKKETSMTLND
ncbi:hypothetical protein O6H91_05G072200 [Diphasiastrum complanatum]|uniref:Uncharacterized protein n=1 Tax=Diphasiastrum complanatum TaxID=34168 RepID=A0ACC2DPC1_DIPCM|nr:hypothetical protein O6H91_05G072200 [Diphasiastrum complanatum]